MSHHNVALKTSAVRVEKEHALPYITHCNRIALDRLNSAFENNRPLAVMIGEGKFGSRQVIGSFLSGVDKEVMVVRLKSPCSDALVCMREIITAIGFEPKDLTLRDLENIFTMFLSFQRTHNRRTILCIEEAQDCDSWVLDKVRRLVLLEARGRYGLLMILSGRPGLRERFNEAPLDAIAHFAKQRITLAPFTQAETREYIRRQVESHGATDIAHVFDFAAITLIHKLGAGVPDAVSGLCGKSLQLSKQDNIAPITPELVRKASRSLKLASVMGSSETADTASLEMNDPSPPKPKLIVRKNGEVVQVLPLNGGHVLIGRDEFCEVCIHSRLVSRHHAFVINTPKGTRIADLGSTNGTFLGGQKIHQHTLHDSDVIAVGECRIEYVSGDDPQGWFIDLDRTDKFEPQQHLVEASHDVSQGGNDAR